MVLREKSTNKVSLSNSDLEKYAVVLRETSYLSATTVMHPGEE